MNRFVVWMDSENAHLFNMQGAATVKTHVKLEGMDHHTENKKDHHGDSRTEHFFRDLALKLKGVDELLLVGPGLAKTHFKTHLETHHNADLAKKILGIEVVDHPTDPQILAIARQFFKGMA